MYLLLLSNKFFNFQGEGFIIFLYLNTVNRKGNIYHKRLFSSDPFSKTSSANRTNECWYFL